MSQDEEEPIWINTEAMLALRVPAADLGLAMTILFEVWWPTKEPFRFDPPMLFERLKETVPDLTVEQIEASRDGAARLFMVLPDGRWAPSPRLFTLNDPDDGDPQIRPVTPKAPRSDR